MGKRRPLTDDDHVFLMLVDMGKARAVRHHNRQWWSAVPIGGRDIQRSYRKMRDRGIVIVRHDGWANDSTQCGRIIRQTKQVTPPDLI